MTDCPYAYCDGYGLKTCARRTACNRCAIKLLHAHAATCLAHNPARGRTVDAWDRLTVGASAHCPLYASCEHEHGTHAPQRHWPADAPFGPAPLPTRADFADDKARA
jgi:hypothetical protein